MITITHPYRALATAALVLLPLLTACGGGSEVRLDPAGAEPGDTETVDEVVAPDFFLACGLLTPDEAATVLAGPSDPGEQSGMLSTETGASDCTWNRADGSSTSLTVTVYADLSLWDVERMTGTANPERVPDLGDESYIARSTFEDTVGFVAGDQVVFLTTQFANGQDEQLVDVAHLVADRL